VALDSQTGLNLAFLSIHNRRPPFDDVRVRQALSRLVQRRALVDDVLQGHGVPAEGPLPPALGAAANPRARPADRVLARRLLARAGHAEGLTATLLLPRAPRPYLPDPRRLAERLSQDFAAGGVTLRLVEVADWSEYVARCTRGDYELALLGWQADTLDPNDFLSALLASAAVGRTNRSRYASTEMDLLLERGRRSTDAVQRAGLYREAQALFQRDMPWVPLYHASVFTAYRRAVHGVSASPTGVLRYEKAWKTE
jgi:dipeptide transport system substrate-binding protein